MRFKPRRRWLSLPILSFIILTVYSLWPARSHFTISSETTRVTDATDPGGFIDYSKALNDRLSAGITPENNAKVLIVQALGPRPEGGDMPPEFYQRLGMTPPPDKGEYIVSWTKFKKDRPDPDPDDVAGLFEQERNVDSEIYERSQWPWRAADHKDVAEWLKLNEKPLKLIAEACKRTQYFNPLVSKNPEPQSFRLMSSLLPTVQKCREIAMLLRSRAMLRIDEGNFDAAWTDLMNCQRLGRLVARGGTLIEGLVGVAINAIANHGQVVFLHFAKDPPEKLRSRQADLRTLLPLRNAGDTLDLAERYMSLDILMTMIARGPQQMEKFDSPNAGGLTQESAMQRMLRRSIDYDPAMKIVNEKFDRCAAACRLPSRAERQREMDKIEQELRDNKREISETNFVKRLWMGNEERGENIGKIMVGLMTPAFTKVQDASDRTEQAARNLDLAFAIAIYRAENGSYPENLEALAPKYIDRMMLDILERDIFSDKPLIYRRTNDGYLLYSVGVNGKDDEGRWIDDQPPGDDVRVRMPAVRPKQK